MSRIYQNHLVDPTFFDDAIMEFTFIYDWYVEIDKSTDSHFRLTHTFNKTIIKGSLQSDGKSISQSNKGNTVKMTYKFYCKSLYRIKIGDFINYKDKWLYVNQVQDYDEWGVRECELEMIQLSDNKDLLEYVKYLNGEILV